MIEEMKTLAREKDVCVLATASSDVPHCSLMAYATDEECSEFYMVTRRDTRKYRNLVENPSVSLLIDTREERKGSRLSGGRAMTVSGVFEPLKDGREAWAARQSLVKRHPELEVLLDHPNSELIRIRVHSFLLLKGLTDAQFVELRSPDRTMG
jgi:nitroimidazol reductase NimA-like FMN-containing flavoprotein (pyridoxamine 5'-phosphate oxidase superfamily)